MTEEQWDQSCARVTDEMTKYVERFATPISMSEEYGSGIAWGTGTYVEGTNSTWLLTANHVFTDVPKGGRLAHLPSPGGDYIAILSNPESQAWPVDAAAFPLQPFPPIQPAPVRIMPAALIGASFSAVDGEMLFWAGFPGYTIDRDDVPTETRQRVTLFGQLTIPMKPMLSQAIQGCNPTHEAFDQGKHIAIHYPSVGRRTVDNAPASLPHPKGMSGSLLWDTKFVQALLDHKPWGPELAEVCGIVWAVLDSPKVVLATKIEHVRSGLPNMFGLRG